MAYPNTIQDLTNQRYGELRYDASGEMIKGDFVESVITLLEQCGIDFDGTNHQTGEYDDAVADAVQAFQLKLGLTETGILNNSTYQSMIYYEQKLNDAVYDESGEIVADGTDVSTSPHFGSFFRTDNFKQFRKNHQDIKIIFGDGTIVKTIKDVHIRSVTVEVDTSGNPISEVYEFIARDLTESDEISDATKYVGVESMAPSDIKYVYNFNKKT